MTLIAFTDNDVSSSHRPWKIPTNAIHRMSIGEGDLNSSHRLWKISTNVIRLHFHWRWGLEQLSSPLENTDERYSYAFPSVMGLEQFPSPLKNTNEHNMSVCPLVIYIVLDRPCLYYLLSSLQNI